MKKHTTRPALLFALIASLGVSTPTYAIFGVGDIVFDPTNIVQTTTTAIEEVSQTLKQVEQYTTQLQQYEDQITNTLAPAAYVWDKAQSTMNGLVSAVDTLSYYKNQVGSLDGYLGKFQNVAYYRGSPCFSSGGCSDAEKAVMQQNRTLASESQKMANDALFRGLDRQQNALKNDASTLEQLQNGAQSATGRMQAIQYANQLASQQANQLLQIRGLLIAQQNAIVTRNQVLADREAQEAAASEQLRRSKYQKSPEVNWGIR